MRIALLSAAALAVLAVWTPSVRARTLPVGAGLEFTSPSAAIAASQPGDTVHIAPGRYFDCASVKQDRVIIEGEGAETVLTDKTCAGKALLVIDSSDVTVRNMTLQRARVPDGNGAGIRAEGGSLTVENVHFINNQDGILAGDNERAKMRIVQSEFLANGSCQNNGGCAHGVYVGRLAELRIENSRVLGTKDGHAIKSKALVTKITGTTIEDGPDGTSSYLIDIPSGGNVLIEGCTLEKGPNASNHTTAITIGEEGVEQPTDSILVRNNRFANDMAYPTIFVRNLTAQPAELVGNTLTGKVRPLVGDGSSH